MIGVDGMTAEIIASRGPLLEEVDAIIRARSDDDCNDWRHDEDDRSGQPIPHQLQEPRACANEAPRHCGDSPLPGFGMSNARTIPILSIVPRSCVFLRR